MKRWTLAFLLLGGCTEGQPFLHHSLSFKKLQDACTGEPQQFSMNSNINGERYVFRQCLQPDFSEKDMTIERHGDTVQVRFDHNGKAQALFELTLDVDTYPRYHFLTLEDNTFTIIPAGN